MSDKKLSEALREHAEGFESHPDGAFYARTADEARALEERVAELERTAREKRNWREAHAEANARAEAAERKLEMHIAAHDMTSDQLEAAEAEALKLDEESYLMAERLHAAEKRLEGEIALGQEHYRARREAEAEVARLRAKLEKVRAYAECPPRTTDLLAILDGSDD